VKYTKVLQEISSGFAREVLKSKKLKVGGKWEIGVNTKTLSSSYLSKYQSSGFFNTVALQYLLYIVPFLEIFFKWSGTKQRRPNGLPIYPYYKEP